MKIQVHQVQIHALNMRARMPFRYGIASLEALPHVFIKVEVEINGKRSVGIASDGLPPKWFTKDPNTAFDQELRDMLEVIQNAATSVCQLGVFESVFELWTALMDAQENWADERKFPPLLAFFGVSLLERAVIDAFCRSHSISFHQALLNNSLGIRPEAFHRELNRMEWSQVISGRPRDEMIVRHTVGLTDPLTDSDVPSDEKLTDGLPQSLEASIQRYGLQYFKIKIRGNLEADLERLIRLSEVIDRNTQGVFSFTLDGNEQYQNIQSFRDHWEVFKSEPKLTGFWRSLLFVEQPLHRDHALNIGVQKELNQWPERPSMIIDESDSEISSLPEALEYGYSGVSHKNCKSVIKGVINACLIANRRRSHPDHAWILSSEDLANVGPVALTQDLAVAAALGIQHSERNGHHYFAGLSMYPKAIQTAVLENHSDLYAVSEAGFPALRVEAGKIRLGSVNSAPFGYGIEMDTTQFTPIDEWDPASLGSA